MNPSARTVQALKGSTPLPPYLYPLIPLGWCYSGLMRLRALFYRAGVTRRRSLPCRTVSIGNITAGGTGKTPMTVYVCETLAEMGKSPVVLTRGYGGSAEGSTLVVSDGAGNVASPEVAGDEAVMLARRLPGVPVVMGADRYSAGMLATREFDPDVAVLDDGYQHMRLGRDMNIALLDSEKPFGNGRTLPAGYLREPVSALKRADAVVFTRANSAGLTALESNINAVNRISPGIPVFVTSHRPKRLYSLYDGEKFEIDLVRDNNMFWFCGLADPDSFALILKELHVNIYGFRVYPDHHGYTQADLDGLVREAAVSGASALITTEKDAVKLAGLKPGGMRVMVLGVDISFRSEEKKFKDMLARSAG